MGALRSVFLLRGGNCNNGAHCGFSYWNVNNLFSNANWNIGPSVSYHCLELINNNAPIGQYPTDA